MSELDKILQERGQTHGDYAQQAMVSQMLMGTIKDYNNSHLTPVMRESLQMICHKLARISTGRADVIDHWDDIAGYATLVANNLRKIEEVMEKQKTTPAPPPMSPPMSPPAPPPMTPMSPQTVVPSFTAPK